MNLKQYLSANELTDSEFGRLVGASASMVNYWAAGQKLPSRHYMAVIYERTHGRVSPNDFYELPELIEAPRPRALGA